VRLEEEEEDCIEVLSWKYEYVRKEKTCYSEIVKWEGFIGKNKYEILDHLLEKILLRKKAVSFDLF